MAFSSAQDIHVSMTTAEATSATPAEIEVRDVPDISPPLHASAVVHRVLAARGLTDVSELDFSLAHLPTPDTLPGIDKAVARLQRALACQERITIVGDYDCDGATSTTVAVLGLAGWLTALGNINDGRRQPITKFKTVRYQIVDLFKTHHRKSQNGDRGAGGPITVVVTDDRDALLAG